MDNIFRRLGAGVVVAMSLVAEAAAEEFRIETEVFAGKQKEPFAKNLTLFTDGLVYDFSLLGPEEITVLDPARGRFVLLDLKRQIRTTLTTKELLEITAAIKTHAPEMDGVFAFAANPQFETQFDTEKNMLTLRSAVLTYRAKALSPKFASAVSSYQQFADWYARLNAVRPGSLPPFARIELNKALAERGLIPEEVELTVAPTNRLVGRTVVIRSQHAVNWRLSNTDRKQIETAGSHMAEFQPVGFKEYTRKTEPPKK
jgi:hypothetical protein